jgi:hypothetical protein
MSNDQPEVAIDDMRRIQIGEFFLNDPAQQRPTTILLAKAPLFGRVVQGAAGRI